MPHREFHWFTNVYSFRVTFKKRYMETLMDPNESYKCAITLFDPLKSWSLEVVFPLPDMVSHIFIPDQQPERRKRGAGAIVTAGPGRASFCVARAHDSAPMQARPCTHPMASRRVE